MSLFLFLFVLYVTVGVILTPMFTRTRYKELCLDGYEEKVARVYAVRQSWAKSIVWPISVANHVAMKPILAKAEEDRQREKERLEVARILREEEERDPINKAFKQLEKEEMLRVQQEKEAEVALERENRRKENLEKLKNLNTAADKIPVRLYQDAIDSLRKKQKQESPPSIDFARGGRLTQFTVNGDTTYTDLRTPELKKFEDEDKYIAFLDSCIDDEYDITHIRRGDGSIMKTVYTPATTNIHRSDAEIIADYELLIVNINKSRLAFDQMRRIFDRCPSGVEQDVMMQELMRIRDKFAGEVEQLKALEREVHEKNNL